MTSSLVLGRGGRRVTLQARPEIVMPSISAVPSTVDGVKRLAKTIKRERRVPHYVALDLAARQAGCQNFRHALSYFGQNPPAPECSTAYLTAYWSHGGGGRETLAVLLPRPARDIVNPNWVTLARNLNGFRFEADDHFERKVDLEHQVDARKALFAAFGTLRFMAATGLRPVTTIKERMLLRIFQDMPGRDHASGWIQRDTGAWVFLNEPYSTSPERQSVWARDRGIQMISPPWDGLYNPGNSVPYLFCADAAYASKLDSQLSRHQQDMPEEIWDGESGLYFSLFVSPARAAAGKPRRSRPMPAYRGEERQGALPYGANRGGEISLWRPSQRMSLDLHMNAGSLLSTLANSELPSAAHDAIGRVRSLLDDWLAMEYPGDELTMDQFNNAYYGGRPETFAARDKQTDAVQLVVKILRQGYADCRPLRQVLNRLAAVEEVLAKRR